MNTEGLEYSNGTYTGKGRIEGNPRRVGDLPRLLGLPEENLAIASFLRHLRKQGSELQTGLLDKLEGRPFVDIGAGSEGEGYAVARTVGASFYVGIEGYFARELSARIREQASSQDDKYPAIGFCVISEDMLAALQRFPNDSVNVFASSLDSLILGREYMLRVAGEITRVQLESGLFVNISSDIETAGKRARFDLAICYEKHA